MAPSTTTVVWTRNARNGRLAPDLRTTAAARELERRAAEARRRARYHARREERAKHAANVNRLMAHTCAVADAACRFVQHAIKRVAQHPAFPK